MTNLFTESLLLLASDKMSERYNNGQYVRILKRANRLYSNKEKSAVYRNIFRVLALYKTGNELWFSEYGYILHHNQLEVFGVDDANYIRLFLLNEFNQDLSEIEMDMPFNFSEVSKRTKNYFAL